MAAFALNLAHKVDKPPLRVYTRTQGYHAWHTEATECQVDIENRTENDSSRMADHDTEKIDVHILDHFKSEQYICNEEEVPVWQQVPLGQLNFLLEVCFKKCLNSNILKCDCLYPQTKLCGTKENKPDLTSFYFNMSCFNEPWPSQPKRQEKTFPINNRA